MGMRLLSEQKPLGDKSVVVSCCFVLVISITDFLFAEYVIQVFPTLGATQGKGFELGFNFLSRTH